MTSFDRKHVLITGGSEGIGLALAEQCGRRGAAVSIVARSQSKLDRAASHLERLGIECATASADVADSDALLTAIAHLEERTAPVDIVVACAGYAIPGYVESQSADEYRREMEVNYLGTVHAVKAVLDGMLERGAGHVVAISSTAGLLGVFGYTAYCPTKYAVRGFADALRAEVAGRGINVSIVYPPDTDTPGFAAENQFKPAETAAVSGSIKPMSAEAVARRIADGIERNTFEIFCDPLTTVVAKTYGSLGGLIRAYGDRVVAKARPKR